MWTWYCWTLASNPTQAIPVPPRLWLHPWPRGVPWPHTRILLNARMQTKLHTVIVMADSSSSVMVSVADPSSRSAEPQSEWTSWSARLVLKCPKLLNTARWHLGCACPWTVPTTTMDPSSSPYLFRFLLRECYIVVPLLRVFCHVRTQCTKELMLWESPPYKAVLFLCTWCTRWFARLAYYLQRSCKGCINLGHSPSQCVLYKYTEPKL